MAFGMLGNTVNHLLAQSDGVEYLFATRIFIEAGLARQAATEARKEHIAALRAALQDNGASIDDSQRFYETDMAFHAVLYTVPGNPIFPALHRSFCDWLAAHWRQMPRLPDRNRRNHQAHQAILDRDPDRAENTLRQHLQDAWAQVEGTFAPPQINQPTDRQALLACRRANTANPKQVQARPTKTQPPNQTPKSSAEEIAIRVNNLYGQAGAPPANSSEPKKPTPSSQPKPKRPTSRSARLQAAN